MRKERRSVEKLIHFWMDWEKFMALVDSLDHETAFAVLTLFKTGGRACEILGLKRSQCGYTSRHGVELFEIRRMTVLKWHSEKDQWRNVGIRMDEQLTKQWIDMMPEAGELFDYNYKHLYYIIKNIQYPDDLGFWPHRFRAERAIQLRDERSFDALQLQQFFKMSSIETPLHYASPEYEAVLTALTTQTKRSDVKD